jgi:hypothetical protein
MRKTWTEQDLDSLGLTKQSDGTYKKQGAAKIIGDSIPIINKKVKAIGKKIPKGMNELEKSYSLELEYRKIHKVILDFKFEKIKLKLADGTYYIPDFMVVNTDGTIHFHEVKGTWKGQKHAHWEDDARVKIKVAAQMFPEFKFIAVSKRQENGQWHIEHFYNS